MYYYYISTSREIKTPLSYISAAYLRNLVGSILNLALLPKKKHKISKRGGYGETPSLIIRWLVSWAVLSSSLERFHGTKLILYIQKNRTSPLPGQDLGTSTIFL